MNSFNKKTNEFKQSKIKKSSTLPRIRYKHLWNASDKEKYCGNILAFNVSFYNLNKLQLEIFSIEKL